MQLTQLLLSGKHVVSLSTFSSLHHVLTTPVPTSDARQLFSAHPLLQTAQSKRDSQTAQLLLKLEHGIQSLLFVTLTVEEQGVPTL